MEIIILKTIGTAMLNILVLLVTVGFVKDNYLSSWIKTTILIILSLSTVTILAGVLSLIWI